MVVQEAGFTLTSPEVIADPYPLYRRMREERPIHWNRSVKGWVVSRYADVRQVLRDPRFSVEKLAPFQAHMGAGPAQAIAALTGVLEHWMVFNDPPRHTRLRRALSKAFMPREIEKLRPRVQALVDELLEPVIPRGEMDLIADFAFPLPASVIGGMFGMPRHDIGRLKPWSDDLAKFVLVGRATPDKYARSHAALLEMADYFRWLIDEHRRAPQEDLTSLLLDGGGDAPLNDEEIVGTMALLLFAGHETTTNLIANGMLALLEHPRCLHALQADPALIPGAVEEMLRYDAPVQTVVRVATADVPIADTVVRSGERLFAILSAANRDPEAFDGADGFDPARPRNRHLAFGLGIHLCLGAPLARLEGQVAFASLLGRLRDFRLLTERLRWRDELITRGVEALPLAFRAAA